MRIFALLIAAAIIGLAQPSLALDTDLQDTRIKSAERLERVMPVEWLADNMIEEHAKKILPMNHQMLRDHIVASIDWKKMRDHNVRALAARFTTDDLDYWAGEHFTRSGIRSGSVKTVFLPETRALLRSAIEQATWDFERRQAQLTPGFTLSRQSFLEYQARNGVYYYTNTMNYMPVTQYWTVPTYSTWYYGDGVHY